MATAKGSVSLLGLASIQLSAVPTSNHERHVQSHADSISRLRMSATCWLTLRASTNNSSWTCINNRDFRPAR